MTASVWRKRGKRFLRFALFAPIALPLGYLPRPWARALSRRLGDLCRLVLPRETRRARRHLETAFPQQSAADREQLVKETFHHVGHLAVDFLRIRRGLSAELLRNLDVTGEEHLRSTEESGRPTLLITAHFGNWELLAAYLADRERSIHVLYHPFPEQRLNRFVEETRERAGVRLISAEQPAPAMRALLRQELVGILVDRIPRDGGVSCRFFGKECFTTPGAARLALRAGALVLCAALWEDASSGYRVRFWPAWDLSGQTDVPGAAEEISRRMTAWTEEIVREEPSQWPWFYNRWKVRSGRNKTAAAARDGNDRGDERVDTE